MMSKGLLEAVWEVYPPVTENAYLELDGVQSFAFHNNGTTNVILNDHWTVKPGSTQQLTVALPNMVVNTRIKVSFAAGVTNLLEVSAMRLKGYPYSNFTKDDPTN